MNVKGTVDNIYTKEWKGRTLYSVSVDGTSYGMGQVKPEAKEGDLVEFMAEQKGQYWNAVPASFKKLADAPKAAKTTPPKEDWNSRAKYWENKEERDKVKDARISYQAAVNTSVAMCTAALTHGILPMPTKKADSFEVFESHVLETANRLYEIYMAVGEEEPPVPGSEDSDESLDEDWPAIIE